ncbi:MAG: hypothetical protein ACREVO_12605 [Steroidobacteraceae bacterium]
MDRPEEGRFGRGREAPLDAQELVAVALKRARRKAFDDPSFVPPLRRLITSCNSESDLNGLGRHAVKFEIRRSLHNLLEFAHAADGDAARRMRKWLGNRSNRGHRQRRYHLARFGLDPEVLRARFKPYTDTFGIELEWPPPARTPRSARN